jgi:drug/metabolite transporter (DMT)-like permease
MSFIFSLQPLVTAGLSMFILKEKINYKKIIALSLGLFGFCLLFIFNPIKNFDMLSNLKYLFILIIAMIASAYGWILVKKINSTNNIDILLVSSLTFIFGGIFSFVNSIIIENWQANILDLNLLYYCIFAAILIHILFYNFYSFALSYYSATFMSFSNFLATIFTAILGWFLIGEQVTLLFIISASFVFLGLTIFYREETKCQINQPQFKNLN